MRNKQKTFEQSPRSDRQFDAYGRERPVDHQRWLNEIDKRIAGHLHNCIVCMRIKLGLARQECGVGNQLAHQRQIVVTAMGANAVKEPESE